MNSPPMNNVTKLFSCCQTFVHQRKIILNQHFFPGFEGMDDCSICKSVMSKLLILVVGSQAKKNYIIRGGSLRIVLNWRQSLSHKIIDNVFLFV